MRAAVYLRMSSDRTGDGLGIERQRADALALISRRGWELAADPFVDNDRSAARGKERPAFRGLLAMLTERRADAVVAWSLDRLARNARDRVALIETCQDAAVTIALVRGSDIDCSTASGRLTAGVLGEVAQHEIDLKSERQHRAAEQAADRGRWIGGRRPFGYDDDGVTVRPDEAEAVRAGYRDVLAGVPLAAIAARWNADGFRTGQRPHRRTERGEWSPWRTDSVRVVLRNPRYAGIRTLRGEERGQAEWPAIVSEATFRAVAAVLADPVRNTGAAGKAGQQLLTGVALCARCGATVHGGGAGHGKPIYRCSGVGGQPEIGTGTGAHVNRLRDPVDEYVGELVIARLSRPDAAHLLVDEERPDVDELRDQALVLQRRLDELAVEFSDGSLTGSQLRVATSRLRTQLADTEAELADAGRVDMLGPLVGAVDVRTAWADLGRAEHGGAARQRTVIDALMTVILHGPGRGSRTFRPETVEARPKQ